MNKQTSAQQMYKEYITDIHADSTALESLLNGERSPVNPGARIKHHSTGKVAAVTTAAAAIAICAGIGFSSFGSDDTQSSPSAGAATPKVTTAQQPASITPSAQGDFRTEVTDIIGGTHGMCATLKLTGLTEKGKTLIKEQGDQLSSDQSFFGTGIAAMSFSTPVASGDSCTMQVSFVPQKFTGFESNLGVDIFLRFPSDPSGAITDPGRKVSFNIPITPCELHFRSDKGEDIWLTDHYIASGHNPSDPQKKYLYTIKNKDGSVKELTESDNINSAGASDYLSYSLCYFRVKLNTADIESITYDGIEFKPAKQGNEKFKTELVQTKASDHGMIATVKLTALNDEAKKYMNKDLSVSYQASNEALMSRLIGCNVDIVSDNTLIANVGFAGHDENDKVANGDTVSALFRLPITGADAQGTSESMESAMAAEGRHIEITINKNKKERTLRSKDGKTLFLSDFHLTAHNIRSTISVKNITVKYADGTTLTEADIGMLGGSAGTPNNKGTSATIYFEKDITADKVVSVTFNGTQYTPQ